MNADSHRTFGEFQKALRKLGEFLSLPIENDRDRAGIIQAFEFTYEIAWITIKKMSVDHGKTIGSPKQAFQAGFELGWIAEDDMPLFISMIKDRNLTSHTYKEDLAEQILKRIQDHHLATLEKLEEILVSKQ